MEPEVDQIYFNGNLNLPCKILETFDKDKMSKILYKDNNGNGWITFTMNYHLIIK